MRRGRRRSPAAPPPVLGTSRVLWHADSRAPGVRYSGHSGLFVDGVELGPVPRLAIGDDLISRDIGLLHCSRSWEVLGCTVVSSVKAAKDRAVRSYPGVERQWVRADGSKAAARKYLDDVVFEGWRCGFCGRRPYEVDSWFTGRGAHVCDRCVVGLHEMLG